MLKRSIPAILAVAALATPALAQDDPAAIDAYGKLLNQHIAKFNAYPKNADDEGTAIVFLEIDRLGKLEHAEIAQSSGSTALDKAALDAVTKANPYPPIPQGTFPGTDVAEFTVPLLYMQ